MAPDMVPRAFCPYDNMHPQSFLPVSVTPMNAEHSHKSSLPALAAIMCEAGVASMLEPFKFVWSLPTFSACMEALALKGSVVSTYRRNRSSWMLHLSSQESLNGALKAFNIRRGQLKVNSPMMLAILHVHTLKHIILATSSYMRPPAYNGGCFALDGPGL